MSADRYEITDDGALTISIKLGENTQYVDELEDDFVVGAIRQQARDLEQLRTDLAAAVAERDRIKGDHDEAAHFARHFIRDDPAITPRGAIIRLGDKCTDLFVRLQQAEARLSAIDSAPVVAVIDRGEEGPIFADLKLEYECSEKPISIGTELIAKPAKD